MTFVVIYTFNVKDGKQFQFEKAWQDMTDLIYQYEGSLGSRLHKESETKYVAYAQWPNKAKWENSGDKLPDEANQIRTKMREACDEIKTEHKLHVVSDLIKDEIKK